MPRPRKARVCSCFNHSGCPTLFKPVGTDPRELEILYLGRDEIEALHLCDGEGKTQEEAGVSMGVSRGTVQRLVTGARHKVARALVGQKGLALCDELPAAAGEGAEKE